MTEKRRETDLDAATNAFFEARGFEVFSEVPWSRSKRSPVIDKVAVKFVEDRADFREKCVSANIAELVTVEMKTVTSKAVLRQAVANRKFSRQAWAVTPTTPSEATLETVQRKHVGLLQITTDGPVVRVEPRLPGVPERGPALDRLLSMMHPDQKGIVAGSRDGHRPSTPYKRMVAAIEAAVEENGPMSLEALEKLPEVHYAGSASQRVRGLRIALVKYEKARFVVDDDGVVSPYEPPRAELDFSSVTPEAEAAWAPYRALMTMRLGMGDRRDKFVLQLGPKDAAYLGKMCWILKRKGRLTKERAQLLQEYCAALRVVAPEQDRVRELTGRKWLAEADKEISVDSAERLGELGSGDIPPGPGI